MDSPRIVAYYRVSTHLQGFNGLGMAAQREAVETYARTTSGKILASYEEVETARKNDLRNRPQLLAAIAHARRSGATLVIARLDRLARSVLVTAQLLQSNLDFVCCDNPHANRLTIQMLAVMAENESNLISARVKAAIEARKARGVIFVPTCRLSEEARRKGQAASRIANRERAHADCLDLLPILKKRAAAGDGLQAMASHLNELGHSNRRGQPWSKSNIRALLRREGIEQAPMRYNIISPEVQRLGVAAAVLLRKQRIEPILTAIRNGVAEAQTFRTIAEELNQAGSRTAVGTRWSTSSLSDLAKNHAIVYPYRPKQKAPPAKLSKRHGAMEQQKAAFDFYAPIIPLIQRLREHGYSLKRVATVLNDAGYSTSHGGRWLSLTVWKVLRRDAACRPSLEPNPTIRF